MKTILDIKPRSILNRAMVELLIPLIIFIFYFFGQPLGGIIFMILIYLLGIIIYSASDYDYFVYKIKIENQIIEINYYYWFAKKTLKININDLKLTLSQRGSHLGRLVTIVFSENKKKLLELHEEKGILKKYWTKEKVNEIYETLINLQNQVKEEHNADN